ncbi:MAG: diaminopimelate epimerase, partial [Mycobacterium sp.]|nr:diaminopimelate epimerase [Mycobacterium sp.]
RVLGGEVRVGITDATSFLRGPSVLVARGELSALWWAAHRCATSPDHGTIEERL